MSGATGDYIERLTLAEQVARIEQMNEETHKFVVEARKLEAEQHKLVAERDKLHLERRKLDRDRAFAPWTLVVATLGGFAAFFAAGAAFMRTWGGP